MRKGGLSGWAMAACAAIAAATSAPAAAQSGWGLYDPDDDMTYLLDDKGSTGHKLYVAVTELCPNILLNSDNKAINEKVIEEGFNSDVKVETVPDVGEIRSVTATTDDGALSLGTTIDRKFCGVMIAGDSAERAFDDVKEFIPFMLDDVRQDRSISEAAEKNGVALTRLAIPVAEDSFYVMDFIDSRKVNPQASLIVQTQIQTVTSEE